MTGVDQEADRLPRPVLAFWYEFASTYSYLAASRVEALAREAGIRIAWRPFLLGPIFASQGWSTSPFNLYPAKGAHMWRDLEREAAALGLPPVTRPDPFPQNGLLAARVALVGAEEEWGPAFTRAVFAAAFARGLPIAEQDVIGDILARLGQDTYGVIAKALGERNKAALKAQTARAAELGIFGAPSFVAPDGELFWGNDRLERALAWTRRPAA